VPRWSAKSRCSSASSGGGPPAAHSHLACVRVGQILLPFVPGRRFRCFGLRLGLGLGGRLVPRGRLAVVLVHLEHDVLFERLTQLGLQVEHGQLQQADRHLQLGSQRQLLAELELEGLLHHGQGFNSQPEVFA
jgi:hypothetical protein